MGRANFEQLMNRADVRSELLQIPLRVGYLWEVAAALLSDSKDFYGDWRHIVTFYV